MRVLNIVIAILKILESLAVIICLLALSYGVYFMLPRFVKAIAG